MGMRDFDTPEYKAWRKKVYGRDRYKCQMPGCTSSGHLNAHHIKRWADAPYLRFVVSNGITLCDDCHKLVTGRESEFEGTFMRIVNQKRSRTSAGVSISNVALSALLLSRKRELPGSS